MTHQHVQTKREIEGLLHAAGLHPRKRFGQHFLVDGNLMRKLVASAELHQSDVVVEVGPGTGGLTDLLVPRVRQVLAVEVDRDLCAILEERFADAANIMLISGDVLQRKHALLSNMVEAIRESETGAGGSVKLVANLPYQIATPLVINLLIDHPQVRRLCFTVQAEVGERITARPGCKAFGPISILTQVLCDITSIGRVPPAAFWPRPAVDSVMLRLDVKDSPPVDRASVHAFAGLIRGVFDHRRKTLRSALGYVVPERIREQVCQHVDPKRRPESFSVDEWLDIFSAYRDAT